MVAVVDALGQRTEYQYDEAGNLVYQKDSNKESEKSAGDKDRDKFFKGDRFNK